MKLGNHRYFNTLIEVLPVRTFTKGLCYKLYFGQALKLKAMDPDPLAIFVTSSFENNTDNLEEIHVTVAENNTWQGVVEKKWPYRYVENLVQSNVIALIIRHIIGRYIT